MNPGREGSWVEEEQAQRSRGSLPSEFPKGL